MGLWNSNNLAVRLTKLIGGLTVTAAILMLWPTVVFSFPQKHEKPNSTAHVQSCEDTGPITRRGFGSNWNCAVTIRDDETSETWTTDLDMNFFTPDDVGKEKRLTWGYGGGRFNSNKELRRSKQHAGGRGSSGRPPASEAVRVRTLRLDRVEAVPGEPPLRRLRVG
ncbi:DUF6346 domain-containing protein [Saccharopolyspora sp. ID03-671]|uniref:DUF6346 domain-containing protein n=1 Tax=Saccharopolyspora sp. ID03-671 TaxID=3073066 RepID=UPI00324F987B